MLQNITKHLTPNFQGFTNLCKAHSVMMKVAADINETQRLYEASIRVQVSGVMCVCVCSCVFALPCMCMCACVFACPYYVVICVYVCKHKLIQDSSKFFNVIL